MLSMSYNGKRVATNMQLAEAYGYDPRVLRTFLWRLQIKPLYRLDGRTPLYDVVEVDSWMSARPGTGRRWARNAEPLKR
jgi:hypothetical protein